MIQISYANFCHCHKSSPSFSISIQSQSSYAGWATAGAAPRRCRRRHDAQGNTRAAVRARWDDPHGVAVGSETWPTPTGMGENQTYIEDLMGSDGDIMGYVYIYSQYRGFNEMWWWYSGIFSQQSWTGSVWKWSIQYNIVIHTCYFSMRKCWWIKPHALFWGDDSKIVRVAAIVNQPQDYHTCCATNIL